jgi:hypothetical protein
MRRLLPVLILAVAGCSSSGNGVSTASVLSAAPTPPPVAGAAPAAAQAGAVVPMAPASSPTDRAFQVGSVSARAAKCGYNFDAPRLKASYMASEMGRGTADMGQLEKIYGVAYNGVMKAAVEDPNYCSERKTQEIKGDLARLLAGDFEPPRKALVAQKKDDDEDGFFGGLFSSSSGDSGPKFGSDDWWQKQNDKVGN